MSTTQPAAPTVDHALVWELKDREDARFAAEHPRSAALRDRGLELMPNGLPMAWLRGSYHHIPMWVAQGEGARFTDVDGRTYSDFNIADMSMFCGYAPEPLVRAVSERVATGNQFLLPTEDALVVSAELRRRYGLSKWQYTLSASQANSEAIRVARVATGRQKVLTASITGTSTRRWSSSLRTARWSRRNAGFRRTSPAARAWRRSTTWARFHARSRIGTWRSC